MNSDKQVKDKNGAAISYHVFVSELAKDPAAIVIALTEDKMDLLHGCIGVSGEAGELLDAIKKYAVYNKELDRENVIEELGDIRFYMQLIMNRLCISDHEIITNNVKKLNKRYEKGYSDKAAQERADKVAEIDKVSSTEISNTPIREVIKTVPKITPPLEIEIAELDEHDISNYLLRED